jgi:hypothetical protein
MAVAAPSTGLTRALAESALSIIEQDCWEISAAPETRGPHRSPPGLPLRHHEASQYPKQRIHHAA